VLVRSIVRQSVGVGRQLSPRTRRVRGGELLFLECPPQVMCKDCGTVNSVDAEPTSEKQWQSIAQRFHCVCEVG
jgi:hypothetical protein